MIKATQAALTGPETFELRDADLSPEAGEVVVAIEVCGICSSEIPSFENGPEIDNTPLFLGHEPSGTIAAVGHGVTEFHEGDRVTGAFSGAFATHAVANAEKLIAVPDNVTLKYALGEPLFCITNIARAATPQFGDHVAVVGCGGLDAMGLLDFAPEEAAVSRALLAHARHRVLAADASKWGRAAMCRFAPLTDIDRLVTDQLPASGEYRYALAEAPLSCDIAL